MIVIIDCCGTNISSVQAAITRLGKESIFSHDKEVIKSASHVILPGVSTANMAMTRLKKYGLVDLIPQLKMPVLGICCGMQILYDYSAEGDVDCLGIIPGKVIALPHSNGLAIPHMGWNQLELIAPQNPLLKDIKRDSYCYFVHSYASPVADETLAATEYSMAFSAIIQHKNFYGVQFHPERSGVVGATLLKNFLELSE